MKISGDAVLHAPAERVWETLLDPQVLVRTIPGCERLQETGENAYAMTVTAGVAAIRGTYDGSCELRDLKPHQSLVLHLSGAGAPGTIDATVPVQFSDGGNGTTTLTYEADAIVGGMVGGVGQRMLTSVSKRMAGEFFGAVDDVLTGAAATQPAPPAAASAPAGAETSGPATYYAAAAGERPSRQEFLSGVAVGAGLVLLGAVVGGLLGRRRK